MEFSTTIPELVCKDIQLSLAFYCQKLGFTVLFDRADDGFYFLVKDDIQLMLQQLSELAWMSHDNDVPFGNGLNLAFKTTSLDQFDLVALAADTYRASETLEYKVLDAMAKVRQVIFRDPDGYLIRFVEPMTA